MNNRWNSSRKPQKGKTVIDYRKVDDKYLIASMDALLDKFGKAQYFTTSGVAKGFHQIPVQLEDKEKTANLLASTLLKAHKN